MPAGVSASTGHCKGPSGNDLFYVFSTSATPFEAEMSYSRFAAYAVLNHRGDFGAATKALANAGYGIGRDEWLKRQPQIRIAGKVVRR